MLKRDTETESTVELAASNRESRRLGRQTCATVAQLSCHPDVNDDDEKQSGDLIRSMKYTCYNFYCYTYFKSFVWKFCLGW